jgi:archaellum biogenesis ATPase FlaH
MARLPAETELNSFSGGRLEHIPGLLSTIPSDTKLSTVILAFGINNRACLVSEIDKYMTEVRRACKDKPYKVVFLGVSTTGLSRDPMARIEQINKSLEKSFTYIKPLEKSNIVIDDNLYKIHHDSTTVSKVLDSISYFLGSGRLQRDQTP